MRAASAAFVAAVILVACGGSGYDQRFTPAHAPDDYIPVAIARGDLRRDCHFSHFELRIPPDAAKPAKAKPAGDTLTGWHIAVPKQRLQITSVCELSYEGGTEFRFSTVVDATAADQIDCKHERPGSPDEKPPRGVQLACTNDDPTARTGGPVE